MIQLAVRLLASALLLLLLWPELARYQAEQRLARVQQLLEPVLAQRIGGAEALAAVNTAAELAQSTRPALPGDLRPVHLASLALLLGRRLPEAGMLLETAIRDGDRPELSLSLGRVRGAAGDQPGALRAWIHTAWAQPAAIATLPQDLRNEVLAALPPLEQALREGRHAGLPPPL